MDTHLKTNLKQSGVDDSTICILENQEVTCDIHVNNSTQNYLLKYGVLLKLLDCSTLKTCDVSVLILCGVKAGQALKVKTISESLIGKISADGSSPSTKVFKIIVF